MRSRPAMRLWMSAVVLAFGIPATVRALDGGGAILFPRMGSPLIAKAGGPLFALARLPKGWRVERAELSPLGGPEVRVELETVKNDRDAESGVWKYSGRPREPLPIGLYDLRLVLTGEGGKKGAKTTLVSRAAVKLNKEENAPFSFAVVPGLHFGDGSGRLAYPSLDFDRLRLRILRDINREEVEFAVLLGDLGSDPGRVDRDFRGLQRALLKNLSVPVAAAPGRLEAAPPAFRLLPAPDARRLWRRTFGLRYQSFDYGKSHFVLLDSTAGMDPNGPARIGSGALDAAQFEWLKRDLAEAAAGAKTTFVFCYHSPRNGFIASGSNGMAGGAEVKKLFEENGVKFVFTANGGVNRSESEGGTVYVSTAPSGAPDVPDSGGWGYRLVVVREDGGVDMRYVSFASKEDPTVKGVYR